MTAHLSAKLKQTANRKKMIYCLENLNQVSRLKFDSPLNRGEVFPGYNGFTHLNKIFIPFKIPLRENSIISI